MTTRGDKIIIRYCAAQGATVIQLANHFRKSRQAIYTFIGEEDEWEGISAIEAFNLGVSAEKLLRKLKENNNEATIPFRISPRLHSAIEQRLDLQRRRFAQMREKQEQKEVRRERFVRILESLRNLAGSDSQRDEEVKETIEDDDADTNEVTQDLTRAVIRNLQENANTKYRNRWRFEKATVDIGYIVSRYSQRAYNMMRQVLPFPSRQTLSSRFSEQERILCEAFQDTDQAHILIEHYLDRAPFDSEGEELQCCLAIDAFSINVFKAYDRCIKEVLRELKDEQQEDLIDALEQAGTGATEPGGTQQENEQTESDAIFNNCFIVVLIPFRWTRPHLVLSLFPAESGSANEGVIERIFRLISICSEYRIKIRTIATDGDPGYSGLHSVVSAKWLPDRHKSFEKILEHFQRVKNIPFRLSNGCIEKLHAIPIADPLHALKIARSRVLRRRVFLTRTSSVSGKDFQAFSSESWYRDTSQIGRMMDYHALMMFSPKVAKHMILEKNYSGFMYVWGWTCLTLVLRIPCLSLETRQALLIACFHVFVTLLNKVLDDEFKGTKVYVRFREGAEGVTFFETYYLVRIIHTIFALHIELSNDGKQLRMSAFGTHANENLIGRARVGAAGINSFPVFLRHFARIELTRLLEHIHGISTIIRTRDNIGGTKLDLHEVEQLHALDVGSDTEKFIRAFLDNDELAMEANLVPLCRFINEVIDREGEEFALYEPNKAANAGIMARLINFSGKKT